MNSVSDKGATRNWLGEISWLHSLRGRLLLLVFGMFTGMTLLSIAATSYLDIRDARQQSVAWAMTISTTVTQLALTHLPQENHALLQTELASITADGAVTRLMVYDKKTGRIVTATPEQFSMGLERKPALSPSAEIALGSALRDGKLGIAVEESRITIGNPIHDSLTGSHIGATLIEMARPDIWVSIRTIWTQNAVVAIALLIIGLLIAHRLASGFLAPVSALTETANRISGGELTASFPPQQRDEIGVLSRAYQDMLATIRGNIKHIQNLAFIDSVTGLSNREFFRSLVQKSLQEHPDLGFLIIFIDLDRFKQVNDAYGHDHGDRLLQEIARRVREIVLELGCTGYFPRKIEPLSPELLQDGCNVARLGGDELAVFVPDSCNVEPQLLATRLIETIEAPVTLGAITHVVAASAGISLYPQDGLDYTSLMKSADIAMYEAKKAGGGSYRFYEKRLERVALEHVQREHEIREAIKLKQFEVYFQPQIRCANGRISGVEALARRRHPTLGILPPSNFIDIAEETGLINPLGEMILTMACAQARKWLDEGNPLIVSVNMSVRQLETADLYDQVQNALSEHNLPPEYLELEITESVAMTNPEQIFRNTAPLRDIGVRFALDDFGKGYSSLTHLRRLPFDTFKIDRGFIQDIDTDRNAQLIVKTIIAMARSLHYQTVAEGVERAEQLEELIALGCDTVQGYYFAKPLSADGFDRFRAEFDSKEYQHSQSKQKIARLNAASKK